MADKLTPARRSANMARIRSKDTKPEMIVRRAAHALGFRFRLHRKNLPGKPDLVFPARKAVIFVHGCFWHQHDAQQCADGRRPKSNTGYWSEKLDRNIARDASAQAALAQAGWRSLVIWECETTDPSKLSRIIQDFLKPLRGQPEGELTKTSRAAIEE
ncbi:very short patch repair endonuclease [Pseudomonas sp. FW305-3-2-15-E-TSA4]|nr:very short patch repair endonuclease [Pseudomonas sp. FW305-3-2-15-E-TSA4]